MDWIQNYINDAAYEIGKQFTSPPTVTQFLEKGILTPEEFLQAGDKLIANCGTWKWYDASDPIYRTKYLPDNKQFLGIENVISRMRCNDYNNLNNLNIQQIDDDIIITKDEQYQQQTQDKPENERYYNLYIVYDLYYFTPRLYLAGKDVYGWPLTIDLVKQKDINSEHDDKTVTEDYHPHLNIPLFSIDQKKHADTFQLIQMMIENGSDKDKIHADNSILIFLNFIKSVIPTIQFDFVTEIVIG